MKINSNFMIKPVLVGEKVILRPFEERDWEIMYEILNEPDLKKLTGSVSSDEEAYAAPQPEEKEKIRQWYMTRNEQNNRLDLAVVYKESDQVIGEVVFNEYDEETDNVNFRVLLSEASCNKGVGTEALSMFIQYGIEELELHKISLEVYSFNPRAERVYQKVGFKLEGIKREEFIYNQEYFDTKIYGLLKADYLDKKCGKLDI
ncbi:MAG: GCN5-related N-acetyltransferase [Clostridiales bacterium]|nr:GCN5-related N-acetyltransferase [Clostridiales bacterium]